MKPKRRRRLSLPIRILIVLMGAFVLGTIVLRIFSFVYDHVHPVRYIYSDRNVLEVSIPYIVDGEAAEATVEIPRGTEIHVDSRDGDQYTFRYEGYQITLDASNLRNTLEECLDIDTVYARRLVNLRDEKGGALSQTVLEKGEAVEVIHVDTEDLNRETGEIRWYQIEKDGEEYWISGRYTETSEELATTNWNSNITYSTYWDEYYGEGYSKDAYIDQIDYKPIEKADYENNVMPQNCNAVHISLENLINNKDYYLSLNETTGINAFVIEFKGDGGNIWYDSEAVAEYLDHPEQAISYTFATMEELTDLVEELQDHDYYVIGRIVTFKDQIFASQNPDESITDKNDNLIAHNSEYWPSAYSRKAWMYNVAIAKEIADCGVNEIQFDYVRFPDGLVSLDADIDLHNTYDESKTAALQGFLQYAKEELESYEVYVAADVFAWPMVAQDDQDIGQFFPAIANVVDVVCPMPYSDHFSSGSMNIADPASEPGRVLTEYTRLAAMELDELEHPPVYRSWIQGYGYLSPQEIIDQIRGINASGYQGYMIWYGNGNPEDLETNKEGYIDSALPEE